MPLEKNETTGKIDHPKQTTKIMADGTKVKSVGKDIADSLGGAVYNAVLSVDLNELDYMENVTVAENSSTVLNPFENVADQYFGFSKDPMGAIRINEQPKDEDPEELVSNAINQEVKNTQNILQQIKKNNQNTKLSDSELMDMYNSIAGDGFVIF